MRLIPVAATFVISLCASFAAAEFGDSHAPALQDAEAYGPAIAELVTDEADESPPRRSESRTWHVALYTRAATRIIPPFCLAPPTQRLATATERLTVPAYLAIPPPARTA